MACLFLPRWSLSWKVWSSEQMERQELMPCTQAGGRRSHVYGGKEHMKLCFPLIF